MITKRSNHSSSTRLVRRNHIPVCQPCLNNGNDHMNEEEEDANELWSYDTVYVDDNDLNPLKVSYLLNFDSLYTSDLTDVCYCLYLTLIFSFDSLVALVMNG